jgi:hypothetical protein
MDLPRSLVEAYFKYSFTPYDDRGAWCYSTANQWADITATTTRRLVAALDTLKDPALRANEYETVEKMQVCWRDKGYGTLAHTHDIIVSDPDQASALTPHLRRRGLQYVAFIEAMPSSLLRDLMLKAVVPINRGKGSPSWIPGTNKDAAVLYAALVKGSTTFNDVVTRLRDSSPYNIEPCGTSYVRIQSSRKEVPRWQLLGGNLTQHGTRFGPKTRRIQALPFSFNYVYSGPINILKHIMMHIDDTSTGRIGPAQLAVRQYKYSVATDLSSFDETVSLETIQALRNHVVIPSLRALIRRGAIDHVHANILIEMDEYLDVMPLLSPPLSMADGANMIRVAGTIKSGKKGTSFEGTEINKARGAYKTATLGIKVKYFNQGDDTIVCSDSPRLTDAWFDDRLDVGFKETRSPDTTFLMRRLPQGYAYLSRMVMNTINREPAFEANSYLTAACGIKVRQAILEGHPLQHVYPSCLKGTSDRLDESIMIAEHSPIEVLLAQTLRDATTADQLQDASSTADAAREFGLISEEMRLKLASVALELHTRANATLGELVTMAQPYSPREAATMLEKSTYKRRKR